MPQFSPLVGFSRPASPNLRSKMRCTTMPRCFNSICLASRPRYGRLIYETNAGSNPAALNTLQ